MPARKTNPITVKQRRYIKGVVEGKSKYQAAIDAGYSPNTAKVPSLNIEKLSVKEELNKALERSGLTIQRITDKVSEGMEAKKTFVIGKDGEGTFVETPDHAVQHKYVETAIKLHGIEREVGMPAAMNFFNLTKSDAEKYGA